MQCVDSRWQRASPIVYLEEPSSALGFSFRMMRRFMPLVHGLLQPAPARQGDEKSDRTGHGVANEEHEQHHYGGRGNNDEKNHGKDEKAEGLALDQLRILERIIFYVGDHQERQEV